MEILGADETLRNEILRNEILRADAGALVNFRDNSALFKYKQKIRGSTQNDCSKTLKKWYHRNI